jgi:hypothetical protein
MRTGIISAGVVAVATGASALVFALAWGSDPGTPQMVVAQPDYVWGDTPRDWISWADEIAVVRLVGEERLPLPEEIHPSEEGSVARRVEAKVEARLWAHPDAARVPPVVMLRTTDGWWYDHGEYIPSKDVGTHRAEVGDRLVVAILDSENYGWSLMAGGIPLTHDSRVRIDPDQTDIGRHAEGMTLQQLRETFRAVKPFPDVERFRHLDIEERMIAVHEYASRDEQPAG